MGRPPEKRVQYDADFSVNDRVDFMRHQKIVLVGAGRREVAPK